MHTESYVYLLANKHNNVLVRHESAPPLAAESAAGKARPSAFRTKPWA